MTSDIPRSKTSYIYEAVVIRWVDGDTVDLRVDCGFRTFLEDRFRLVGPQGRGFNAPEVKGAERDVGLETAGYCNEILPTGSAVVIQTFKNRQQGKYGRWLACIYDRGLTQRDLASLLVQESLGEWKDY